MRLTLSLSWSGAPFVESTSLLASRTCRSSFECLVKTSRDGSKSPEKAAPPQSRHAAEAQEPSLHQAKAAFS